MVTDQRERLAGLKLAGRRLVGFRKQAAPEIDEIDEIDERARYSAKRVQLLAVSGMRLGEATRIVSWEVDFEKDQFNVSGGEVGTKNGKTRIVLLFPRLWWIPETIRPDGEEFGQERIVWITSTNSAMESACKAGGLPRLTHHSLRHFSVSNAIEAGVGFRPLRVGSRTRTVEYLSQRGMGIWGNAFIQMAEFSDGEAELRPKAYRIDLRIC